MVNTILTISPLKLMGIDRESCIFDLITIYEK